MSRVTFISDEPSRTKQSFADEADVNKIMARFVATGIPPQMREGFYADVSEIGDYREALERVENAQRMFSDLPAKLRARFSNEPADFLDFIYQADDEELEELGLLPAREESSAEPAPRQRETKGEEEPNSSESAVSDGE